MPEPTTCCARCDADDNPYCENCDRLVGLDGLHVVGVEDRAGRLQVSVESARPVMGCPRCGAVSYTHLTLPTNREV